MTASVHSDANYSDHSDCAKTELRRRRKNDAMMVGAEPTATTVQLLSKLANKIDWRFVFIAFLVFSVFVHVWLQNSMQAAAAFSGKMHDLGADAIAIGLKGAAAFFGSR